MRWPRLSQSLICKQNTTDYAKINTEENIMPNGWNKTYTWTDEQVEKIADTRDFIIETYDEIYDLFNGLEKEIDALVKSLKKDKTWEYYEPGDGRKHTKKGQKDFYDTAITTMNNIYHSLNQAKRSKTIHSKRFLVK